ncbi:hypothetical protein [Acinetobacter sp. ANC 3929]|uniref:hypothetical protein n=1 Tax=Acinetobacter sp. ANC 3929 TaxID=1217707 RepID=UPI0003AABD56|nr:hypothetical protein [Acinetobacter sp. ANC 3929]
MRSEFEKTKAYELCKSWQMDFDEELQTYYSINPMFHSDVTVINSAWRMYQERQTEVDELQKRVDLVKQLIQAYKDEEKELELKEWEQSTIYGRFAIELEQALKGET